MLSSGNDANDPFDEYYGFHEFRPDRRTKSRIWRYMLYSESRQLAKCKICRHEMNFKPSNGTTNLRNHLKCNHYHVYEQEFPPKVGPPKVPKSAQITPESLENPENPFKQE